MGKAGHQYLIYSGPTGSQTSHRTWENHNKISGALQKCKYVNCESYYFEINEWLANLRGQSALGSGGLAVMWFHLAVVVLSSWNNNQDNSGFCGCLRFPWQQQRFKGPHCRSWPSLRKSGEMDPKNMGTVLPLAGLWRLVAHQASPGPSLLSLSSLLPSWAIKGKHLNPLLFVYENMAKDGSPSAKAHFVFLSCLITEFYTSEF